MKSSFVYETGWGKIFIADDGEGITAISFDLPEDVGELCSSQMTDSAAAQLEEYFQGKRKEFTFPMHPRGTDFQRSVWAELRKIPYGQTRSYGEIARELKNPKACRAVGMANNRNPIVIAVPCHRVIGTNGSLVGYAGGLERKERLLALEKGTSVE